MSKSERLWECTLWVDEHSDVVRYNIKTDTAKRAQAAAERRARAEELTMNMMTVKESNNG